MRVLITGATGLVGRRLVRDRLRRGDEVVAVTRHRSRAMSVLNPEGKHPVTVVQGNPAVPGDWQRALDGSDAVIHLAGAGIADRRWNKAYRRSIIDSRIDSAHQIVNAIEDAAAPPRAFVCASAVGYYGDTGETEIDETAPAGDDFLSRLCVRWEEQAWRASELGVRTTLLRVGMVLDPEGGALGRMLPLFRLGLGGPLGRGRQFVPWIHWRDVIGLVDLALVSPRCQGPLNASAPNPVQNREFTSTLGRALGRPAFIPAPAFGLRLALGEFARYLFFSQRVLPAKALDLEYQFHYDDVAAALGAIVQEERGDGPPVVAPAPEPVESDTDIDPDDPVHPAVPVRLLAIGVDGTLLGPDGRLGQGEIQACRDAAAAGCVIVLATVRPPSATRAVVEAIGLTTPTINYNGALIWNPVEGRSQYHEPLPVELVAQVIADSREVEPDVMVGLQILDEWHTDRYIPDFTTRSGRLRPPDREAPLDEILADPVTKLNFYGDAERIERVKAVISERYWKPGRVAVHHTDPQWIQVTHPLVDKGIALQRIAHRLGADRAEVMAIGDSANDRGMLEWAGFSVAVANAEPRLREMADVVVPSNLRHGAAYAIRRFVLEG